MQAQSMINLMISEYFISLSFSISLEHFTHTHSFVSSLLPELLRSCASMFTCIPLPSRVKHHIKFTSSITRETFVIELTDLSSHSVTYLSRLPRTLYFTFYVPPTRRARPESSAFSDYAGDRADNGLRPHLSMSCGGRALPILSLRSSRLVRSLEVCAS
jgi:hypothetical protein